MKNKKLKTITYQSEDMKEIKTLIIITLIIVTVAIGLYFLTENILNRNDEPESPREVAISYTNTIIGAIFDKPYDEYFVFAFSSEDDMADFYEALFRNYETREDALKIYRVDLNDGFSRHVLSEESNPRPTNASEVRINEVALIRFRDGRVRSFYETREDIENALN